jgi:hypothetical protein
MDATYFATAAEWRAWLAGALLRLDRWHTEKHE